MSHCYRATPHVQHEWISDPNRPNETSICPGILLPSWKDTETVTEAIDNVPIGMAGQNVSLGLPGMSGKGIVHFRRNDCHTTASHMSHTWVLGDNDEGEEETVFCLGLDANGRRPDSPYYYKSRKLPWLGEMVETSSPTPGQEVIHSHDQHTIHTHDDYSSHQQPIDNEVMRGMDKISQRPGREVAHWADEAMYKAEEINAAEGPRVYLLWMTPDPLGAIAAACKMYKGEVVRDLSTVTDAERLEYFEQVQRTKLKAPFEFVKFHFLIEGVTRAFTHQMVRQRTAAYAQESLRFAVKEDMPVGLPPSLAGTEVAHPDDNEASDWQENSDRMREIWEDANADIRERYLKLIDMGMPAEDARGLLPHNVLTRLHYTTDLRALLDHAGNRLCTQAQFEWRLVFSKIIEAIRSVSVLNRPGAPGYGPDGLSRVHFADELLSAFRPVCFQTGKCEFKANFDRHCNIRERVDAFEKNGVSSDKWEEDYHWYQDYDGPRYKIPGIKPGEWLLDPGAARKK